MKLIQEKLVIEEYIHPYYEKVNPILHSHILSLPNDSDHPYNVQAKMTARNLQSKELDKLLQWIIQLIERDFLVKAMGEKSPQLHQINGWQWEVECRELWGVEYKKGNYIAEHTHAPYTYSFTYIVNSPQGSPPLIFPTSGHRVKSENGKLILWDGRLIHKVPPAKVDGRCIIAGTFQNMLSHGVPTELIKTGPTNKARHGPR